MVFASDYPHWDSEFPNSVRNITRRSDLSQTQKTAVLGRNAARIYRWDRP